MKEILPRAAGPGGLLLLTIASFGLMIPWLGFYWDDWPVLLTAKLRGFAGFWEFYDYDRPFSAWTYVLLLPLLGDQTAAWHITSLILRWLTAWAAAWSLSGLWPERKPEAWLAASLFAVYPLFTQQAISVAYSQHWICYLLSVYSLGAMIWSQRAFQAGKLRQSALLGASGVVACLLGLLTMEYFAGLELLRPLILWWLIRSPGSGAVGATMTSNVSAASSVTVPTREALTRLAKTWLPYLVSLAAFSLWRIFFFTPTDASEAKVPVLVLQFPGAPLATVLHLAQIALVDLVEILVNVWAAILQPADLVLQDLSVMVSWGVGLLSAATLYLALRHARDRAEVDPQASAWGRRALVLGLAAVLAGPLPAWLTDRQVINGTYSDRFGLPAMLGAGLLFVALFTWLAPSWRKRVFLASLLVGLSVGQHLRTANEYRWSWTKQTRFYWQLSWRAPAIQPHTAIVSDGEIFPLVGLYSTAAGIILLYPNANLPEDQLPYYFYSLGRQFRHDMSTFLTPSPLVTHFRMYHFEGNTQDSLVIQYEPEQNDCLHVLSPRDANVPGLPVLTAQALQNSNLSRILDQPSPGYPHQTLFGPEPERGWCYLYQKASLAAQLNDWQRVVDLADQAQEQGYSMGVDESDTPFEWLPFIEGYAHSGRWQQAQDLTRQAQSYQPGLIASICDLWRSLPPGSERNQFLQELGCANSP